MNTQATTLYVPTMVYQIDNGRLVPIQRIASNANGNPIFGKLEGDNLTGSVKDRAAANMILQAQERGKLKPAYVDALAIIT